MSADAPAPVIVIFGITGDLSKRKLLPALYHLLRQGLLAPQTRIIGISRQSLKPADVLKDVELCVLEVDKVCDPEGLRRVKAALQTFQLQPDATDDYQGLKQLLDGLDDGQARERLLYMSIPAGAYGPIVDRLGQSGLNDRRTRLLLEKPFGYDQRSAGALIKLVHRDFNEQQIYRIDHYLAKETAQNLLAFRIHNPVFSNLWNGKHISKVVVRATETIGVEGRANFYEQTGALRDLVQSHLMQLLGITLMDTPQDMTSRSIHANKQRFFEGLAPADARQAVRGQYASYRQEVRNPDSTVETYARLKLGSTDPAWRDTEMILETGKALDKKVTEVVVTFAAPKGETANNLTFHIQPNEGISFDIEAEQGAHAKLHKAVMDFTYQDTYAERQHIDAYERVLLDAIAGDQSLFASDREVLESWRVLQPVLEAWEQSASGLQTYPVGSPGPKT